jgi:N-acetylglucosaminyldiphosphoundecaprenol N-acetyl-beta-D-mannosaminyltransferase
MHHGYFSDDSEVVSDIGNKKPDILLAAMGMGRQESWLMNRVVPTGVPVSIGVGGSFDVFAGEATRAPHWMQRTGLEWLYRLLKQPSRLGRMAQLPVFLFRVVVQRLQPMQPQRMQPQRQKERQKER